MLDNVFAFFEKLVINFTWTRLTLVAGILLLFAGGTVTFEFYTGHFRLNRIEREVKILDQLIDISKKIENTGKADPVRLAYDRLSRQITPDSDPLSLQLGPLPDFPSRIVWASIPWFALGLLVLITTKSGRWSAISGMLVIAAPFIAVGVSLPDNWDFRILRYVYPWVTMLAVVVAIFVIQRRRAA